MVVSGWEHVGVITPELIFRIRMGGGTSRDVSVYDVSWRPQNDANHQIEIHETILQQVSEECGRFLVGVGTQ